MARHYDSKRRMENKENRSHARYEMDREGNEYARNSINGGAREMKANEDRGYSSYSNSQKLMSRDSTMIKEDWNAACMLPTHTIEKEWPMAGEYMNKGIGTLFSGVQEGLNEDTKAVRANNKPRHY